MAIQYSGGPNVSSTLAAPVDRPTLLAWIRDQLVAAGWTLAVSATNDYKLDSAANAVGMRARLRIYDPGGALTYVYFKFSNVSEIKVMASFCWLLFDATKTYRIIANKFWFATSITPPGASAIAREAVYGGTFAPFTFGTPITEGVFAGSNGGTATDTVGTDSFRTRLHTAGSSAVILNGAILEQANGSPLLHKPHLVVPQGSLVSSGNIVGYGSTWFDGSTLITEPVLSMGVNNTADARIVGQLYDALVYNDAIPEGTILTIDGKSWFVYTISNAGGAAFAKGSLLMLVP